MSRLRVDTTDNAIGEAGYVFALKKTILNVPWKPIHSTEHQFIS